MDCRHLQSNAGCGPTRASQMVVGCGGRRMVALAMDKARGAYFLYGSSIRQTIRGVTAG